MSMAIVLVLCVAAGLFGIIGAIMKQPSGRWRNSASFIVPFLIMLTLFALFPVNLNGEFIGENKINDVSLFRYLDATKVVLTPISNILKEMEAERWKKIFSDVEVSISFYPADVEEGGSINYVWENSEFNFVAKN